METEENGEVSKRSLIKDFQKNLGDMLIMVNKTKNKYQNEILKRKAEIENMNTSFESKFIHNN